MKWVDEGLIVHKKLFGERKQIFTIFTKDHGLARGLVRTSKKHFLDVGNYVTIAWQSRLEEQLGVFSLESCPPHLFVHPYIMTSICHVLKITMPERHPYEALYDILKDMLTHELTLSVDYYIYFELVLLKHLGFEIDISECTFTKSKENLAYVSPKTGKAVCATAGLAYKNRLLALPAFVVDSCYHNVSRNDFARGLALTGYFLEKHFGCVSDARDLLPKLKSFRAKVDD